MTISQPACPLERLPQRSAAARTVSRPQTGVEAVAAGPEGVIITPLLLISPESGYSDNTGKKNADMEKTPLQVC